mgnify:CR=1 FL=1
MIKYNITGYRNMNYKINYLPLSLNKLIIDTINKCVHNLPTQLTYIEIKFNFNKSINKLPCRLEYLCLGKDFDRIINLNKLSKSLKQLIIPNSQKFGGKKLCQSINKTKKLNYKTNIIICTYLTNTFCV